MPSKDLVKITEADLLALFVKDNKLSEFMRLCREINPDKNGVITIVEIDDILRILYPEQLEGKSLKQVYAPYRQNINKILIKYKALIMSLNSKLKAIETNF